MTRGRSETTTKVFVGSLPAGVTPEDLRKLFAPYGAIAECDISNRCGFLHLEDRELAMKAITELNGTEFMGGRISVEKGRVKPRRGGGGGPMRGGGGAGRERGGPYSRGGRDFRGPPRGGPGGYPGQDYAPYPERYGADHYGGPPQRAAGGYDRGYGAPPMDRRGGAPTGYDDRRAGGYPANDRPYGGNVDAYGAQRAYEGGYDDRRAGGYEDRRAGPPQPPMGERRGPPMDGGASRGPGQDLFSRREQGAPKPLAGGYDTSRYGGGANGYGTATGAASYGGGSTAYAATGPAAGYGTSYGASAMPAGGAGGYEDRDGYGAAGDGGYGVAAYGGNGRGGSYDAAYPPLPPQRGYASGGGGPGPRRDMPPGRRF